MKSIMLFLVLSAQAYAVEHEKREPLFLINGKQVPVETALIESIKGQDVYKCQVMETKISKSGTSISLKTKKN